MSLSHLPSWIRETLVHLQIAHNFQQSTKGIHMLKSLLQKRLEQGLSDAYKVSTSITDALAGSITKESTRRKQWVSGATILVLVDGLLRNAIVHGTPSWDMTLAKAMSLAVQSATGMRSGDLARSHGYSNQQVTLLGDLVVKVVNDEKGIRFRLLLTLRYTKGHKYVSTLY